MTAVENYILVVEDDASFGEHLSLILREHSFSPIVCGSAQEALGLFDEKRIVAVLAGVNSVAVSGTELLERVRELNSNVPVILIASYVDCDISIEAVNKSAFGFIAKPINQKYLISSLEKAVEHYRLIDSEKSYTLRLENTLMRKTRELEDAAAMANSLSLEMVQRLAAVAEFRDRYTAAHISRIGFYSKSIAEYMNMYDDFVEAVRVASSFHDIGKIGIPDNILLKKAALTNEEIEIMKGHTVMGSKILSDSSHRTIQMASSIALYHHETWDGKGYPKGLKGGDIPIEARIVKLADQYDALRSERSYKPSMGHDQAYRIIMKGDGRTDPRHFDPEVLNVFAAISPELDEIFRVNQD